MHIYFFFCLFLKRLTRIGHQAPSWAWRKSQWWWEGWSRANSRCFLPHRWSETDDQIILRNLWSGLLQSCSGASLGPQKPLEHHFLCATPSTRRIFFILLNNVNISCQINDSFFSPSPVLHFFCPQKIVVRYVSLSSPCKSKISKLRPGGHLRPAIHFSAARKNDPKKYIPLKNEIWHWVMLSYVTWTPHSVLPIWTSSEPVFCCNQPLASTSAIFSASNWCARVHARTHARTHL